MAVFGQTLGFLDHHFSNLNVAAGWLGRKSGRGFYTYTGKGKKIREQPDTELTQVVAELFRPATGKTPTDQEVVDLHVAIELENNGKAPLELDVGSLKVEELYLDGLLQDELQPASVSGQPLVEPGSTSRVDVVFQPPTTYPSDIDSFGVRFAVRDGSGAVVGQMTPFAPAPPRGVYGDPYWRDPYWGGAYWGGGPYGAYGPWGWSGSWGWSVGWGGLRCR